MAFDPLSESTRKARRSLLGMASATIVTQTFNIRIEDIPLVGIKIAFGPEVLSFIFGMGLIYFSITFIVYGLDDLLNVRLTPFTERRLDYLKTWEEDTRNNLRSHLRTSLRKAPAETVRAYADEIYDRCRANAFAFKDDQDFRKSIDSIAGEIIGYDDPRLLEDVILIIQSSIRSYERMKEKSDLYPAFALLRLYVIELGAPIVLAIIAFLVLNGTIQLQWLVGWFR